MENILTYIFNRISTTNVKLIWTTSMICRMKFPLSNSTTISNKILNKQNTQDISFNIFIWSLWSHEKGNNHGVILQWRKGGMAIMLLSSQIHSLLSLLLPRSVILDGLLLILLVTIKLGHSIQICIFVKSCFQLGCKF